MAENNTSSLNEIEQNFQELIIKRCKFCGFDKYLTENPDFEFPKITTKLLGWENGKYITIPGLFGGFDYFLEETCNGLVLYAEQSSRMDYSSDDYVDIEITISGSRILDGEERAVVRKKFWQLAKKVHEEHLQKIKETQK